MEIWVVGKGPKEEKERTVELKVFKKAACSESCTLVFSFSRLGDLESSGEKGRMPLSS